MISTGSTPQFTAPGDLRRLYLSDNPDDPNVCVKDFCPFHSDDTPSYGVFSDHAFCFGCRRFEGYLDFCARVGYRPEELADGDDPPLHSVNVSGRGRGNSTVYTESQLRELVDFYGQQLISCGKQSYYEARGISSDSASKYRLGYTGRAYAIPVFVRDQLQTIRFRRDDILTTEGSKYWGLSGRNNVYLFAPVGLSDHTYLCEGELDCILLNQLGYTAVSVTNGAGSTLELRQLLTPYLHGLKRLTLALDQDGPGYSAALDLKKSLSSETRVSVRIARWYEKDITDLYLSSGLSGVTRALGPPDESTAILPRKTTTSPLFL